VELVYCCGFQRYTDAIAAERQIKGWTRANKEASIAGDFELLSQLASRAKRG
jgi:putative endonuclease